MRFTIFTFTITTRALTLYFNKGGIPLKDDREISMLE